MPIPLHQPVGTGRTPTASTIVGEIALGAISGRVDRMLVIRQLWGDTSDQKLRDAISILNDVVYQRDDIKYGVGLVELPATAILKEARQTVQQKLKQLEWIW